MINMPFGESHTGVPNEHGIMDMHAILSLIMMCSQTKQSWELLTLKKRSGMIIGIKRRLKFKEKITSYISSRKVTSLYDLNVALWMFTRCIMILKRVEDLQLGVESYQKKLNITRPQTFKSGITKLTPYTAYNDPQGIIYQDKIKRHRLMRLDELYKFCDRTIIDVRSVLHDIANNLRMKYLPKRDWNRKDRKRSHIMIKAIDELLFERRLMRNLERFVGGREYGNDFRLLERTI
ncbi:hypothetical protein Tco_1558123 [Tanacetum coccineum]